MKRALISALALAGTMSMAEAKPFDEMFPGHEGYDQPEVMEALRALDYQQGTIELPGGQVVLDVPEGYYYLDSEDANIVLSYLWGNPESYTLGMIFPANATPWDDAWGLEMTFDEIGYVSDDDADSYDYDDLLKTMQADTRIESRYRVEDGYDSVELLNWAEPPKYDVTERKLHWAQELNFGGAEVNTLNYNLRALGREGVLVVNFIASIEQLQEVKTALPDVSNMISYQEGKRYMDFDPSIDTVAAVGIGGLIAGKALSKKGGLIAAALILLKKFWFILLLPFFWLKSLFRRQSA